MTHSILSFAVLAATTVVAGGCLVMKGHSVDESGVQVSQATLSQVEPGTTTEAWLLAVVGEPTSRRSIDDHTSILRYDYTLTTAKGGAVFLLFADGEQTRESTATVFEVTDGVIARYWQER